ncbi:MAG TPA: thiamine diphosphokinase [Candidatus Limnocylindria bacterium]|nr:thiamine diphosphokinase [Candidatus Limnocylindria bacterium]
MIVAGGRPDPRDADLLADAALVIAADAGACWLDEVGATPDLLVGDLDSIGEPLLQRLMAAGVSVERHAAAKDASDAELALDRAVASGADEIVLLGALAGERLDHELANLLLIADPRWRGVVRDLRIVSGATTVRALHGGEQLELAGSIGDIVTLLPLAGDAQGVTTDGLRYPLSDEELRFGRSRGLSNVVERAGASVWLAGGTLLVVEVRQEGGAR